MKQRIEKLIKETREDISEAASFTKKESWDYVYFNASHAKDLLELIMEEISDHAEKSNRSKRDCKA